MKRRRLLAAVALLAAAIGGAACASNAPAGSRTRPGPINDNLLRESDLLQSGAQDVYRAILAVRPAWLANANASSGSNPVRAYVESTPYRDVTQLAQINISRVREVEFLSGPEATTRLGTGHTAGAIIVRLKR